MPRAPPGIVTAYQQAVLRSDATDDITELLLGFLSMDTGQKAGGGESLSRSAETACPDHRNKPEASNRAGVGSGVQGSMGQ